ncbi:hypothetical protein B9Z55_016008 [Caenorhabditis nigoni]|uniref:DUF3719 domain-containing protein n=1 Tax=Caenorhabditis nigoni TaxID=1611254 RepID=A0A2G5UD14_9PELO|nr:hypothetical protein B9Z55_016008 [Caenorhabditis nigoni]
MLTWSTSTTSLNPNRQNNKQESKLGEQFLKKWDDAVFDGKATGDPELDREAALWRDKFPHLRVMGTSFGRDHKVMHPLPVTPNDYKSTMSQSKSADTVREKVGPSNTKSSLLPKIGDNSKRSFIKK